MADLDQADAAGPHRPTMEAADLLDALPYPSPHLPDAPEDLQRRLFDVTHLETDPHHDSDDITFTIRLPADQLPEVTHRAETISATPEQAERPVPSEGSTSRHVDVVGAPGRIRTCAHGSGGHDCFMLPWASHLDIRAMRYSAWPISLATHSW
ncbi:hypothetical protein [Streptomyces specialis]|uniref:hypothetical protein n=1 Tax=Streptomyces specialis TaxID=498367 RepID=UPI00073F7623|nr:hypothetical protein [Streptomyces specialis]